MHSMPFASGRATELLPRYEHDNFFDSSKFKQRFPAFEVTTYRLGLEQVLAGLVRQA
ncbi:hypothetical protein [Metapseudomonas otitidis]|uniref:hypothetical protein n=1 Tax=Metapseudomonas otitidis TaxID=319939 RepID=UPI0024482F39|nr:hypothetical protein [Pseudomonas otitidis]MDG9783621.1 hypothetical protein [Pseudomonas otitidis]